MKQKNYERIKANFLELQGVSKYALFNYEFHHVSL